MPHDGAAGLLFLDIRTYIPLRKRSSACGSCELNMPPCRAAILQHPVSLYAGLHRHAVSRNTDKRIGGLSVVRGDAMKTEPPVK